MLAAMAILVFGFTALVGVMGAGVATRRTAELRGQAVHAVDAVLSEVRARLAPSAAPPADRRGGDGKGAELTETIELAQIPGYPRLSARVLLQRDAAVPDLALAVVHITWLEGGQQVGEEFRQLIDVRESFPRRIARQRSDS
jgi:hypothetical protein